MNVDRGRLGSSVGRIRVLAMGLALLGAGCAVLGWGSRHMAASLAAQPAAQVSALAKATPTPQILRTLPGMQQGWPGSAEREARAQAHSLLAGLPLIFEPNQGQENLDPADERAKFVTRGAGYSLFLGKDGAILSLVSRQASRPDGARHESDHAQEAARVETLQMKIAGANPNASVTGTDRLPGKSNYLLGNDPAKWRQGVPQFARVRYENVYPGISLIFYGNQGRLEYDFQVAPGADAGQAEIEFNGAKNLAVKDGALVIQAEDGSVRLEAPRVYQDIAGKQQAIEGRFVLRGANRAGFAIGPYDHSRELVIDPILSFSTYFGGTMDELNSSIAVDGNLNIYLAGSTNSPGLATAGALEQSLSGSRNVYIAKIIPPLGSTPAVVDYVTYLGGDGTDTPAGIQVDGSGDAFVAGTTSSSNFPTTKLTAYQNGPEAGSAGTSHVFVTELNTSASGLQFSSYLSGNGTDVASGVAIDASGYIYITGTTTSSDTASTKDQFPASTIPQALPFQNTPRASLQFFVTKVNPRDTGTGSIAYSTYFGGGSFNTATPVAVGGGIAVDTGGNVYFTGTTNFIYSGCTGCGSTDFPILNPYQPCLDQAPPTTITGSITCSGTTNTSLSDAFVAKLNPNAPQGEQLIWSTYLGGTGTDLGAGIALDPGAANVYVVGTTNSTDIGSSVVISNTSSAYQRCLDTPVNPTTGTACTPPSTLANDAFVARLSNPTTTTITTTPVNVTLNYFSYLGGTGAEAGLAIAVDNASGALVTGWTQSNDFPVLVASPIQSALNGTQDAFVARLNTATTVGQTNGSWASYFGGNNLSEGTSITLDVNQGIYFAGDTTSTSLFPLALPLEAANNGGSDAFVAQLGTALQLSVTGVLTLGTNQSYISAGNQATFTYTITNTGPDLANNITLTDNLSSKVTGVPLTFVSAATTAGTCGGASANAVVSCSLPSLQSGSTATVTIVVTPTPSSAGGQASFNGGTVLVSGPGNIVVAHTSVPAQMSDFSLQVGPTNFTVPSAGSTATYQISLQPNPVYAGSISLACTGLPQGATPAFTTNPVNLQGPGTSTLNITTMVRPVVTTSLSPLSRHLYAWWLMVPGLALLAVGAGSDRRWRRMAGMFFLCATFALLLLLPACSHSTTQAPVSGTPPGIYTLTITASSGSDTKSETVTLSVP